MVTEERMTVEERYKYLRLMHESYELADRRAKAAMLDHAVEVTKLNRDYLCHLLNKAGPIRRKRERQRGGVYWRSEVLYVVRVVAEALDWLCAERLQPALVETAQHLATFGEITPSSGVLVTLGQMSVSTVYRLLCHLRQDEPRLPQRRGRGGPTDLAQTIPMTRLDWQIREPGFFEMDLVHHCGPQTIGDYLCTLQWIDIATAWSERVAVYGRSAQAMIEAFTVILSRCPFPIREIHFDNGPEFVNRPLLSFFQGKVSGVRLSRSRPYQKNDNRFVEQKNHTLVRAYLGDDRLDSREQCTLLNRIYEEMWVYYNLFQPVLRQRYKDAERTPDGVLHVHRRHDTAQTPFQRLLAAGALSDVAREDLISLYKLTNPRALRDRIRDQLQLLLPTTHQKGG